MIRVLGDRVLVALPPKEHVQEAATGYTYQAGQTTAGGIILAKPADTFNVEIATRGIVVQVGEKRGQVDLDDVRAELNEALRNPDLRIDLLSRQALIDGIDRVLMRMQPAPFEVAVGQMVVFSPSAGDQISVDGVDYVILHEAEILGIVDPITKADA